METSRLPGWIVRSSFNPWSGVPRGARAQRAGKARMLQRLGQFPGRGTLRGVMSREESVGNAEGARRVSLIRISDFVGFCRRCAAPTKREASFIMYRAVGSQPVCEAIRAKTLRVLRRHGKFLIKTLAIATTSSSSREMLGRIFIRRRWKEFFREKDERIFWLLARVRPKILIFILTRRFVSFKEFRSTRREILLRVAERYF